MEVQGVRDTEHTSGHSDLDSRVLWHVVDASHGQEILRIDHAAENLEQDGYRR